MTLPPIVVVSHREALRSTQIAVEDPRWDLCACWSEEDHIPTSSDCTDLAHSVVRLAAETAHTTALQHAAELVNAVMGWLSPADARRLTDATQALAVRHE